VGRHAVELSNQARHFLRSVLRADAERLLVRLRSFEENPYPLDRKVLEGQDGAGRVRVGSYRIIYRVIVPAGVVQIERIDKRSTAYQ